MPQASVLQRGQVQKVSCANYFAYYYHANKTHFHKKYQLLHLASCGFLKLGNGLVGGVAIDLVKQAREYLYNICY